MAAANENGPGDRGWQSHIRFAPGGAFAYMPGEVLVPEDFANEAAEELDRMRVEEDPQPQEDRVVDERFARFREVRDPVESVARLRMAGFPAQVNHVLFAICCCPPHPASPGADAHYGSPYYGRTFGGSPYYGRAFGGSPYYGRALQGGAGCCGCGGGWWNDPNNWEAKYASASPSPFVGPWMQASGNHRSSARPHEPLDPPQVAGVSAPVATAKVTILDTGYADGSFSPTGMAGITLSGFDGEVPDDDGDGFLDPMAGHGTFIAGVVERFAPGCDIEVIRVLKPHGEGDEVTISTKLRELADRDSDRPDLVNLSFGAYAPMGMNVLAETIMDLRRSGTMVVAAAGNDGTCVPMYPAAFADVVAVGALDHDGASKLEGNEPAAPFTNYGLWVDACTSGAEIVSTFFQGFNGAEPATDGEDPDDFTAGWAVWSGTSFAAPRVVAELARLVQAGRTPLQAKEELIDNGTRKRAMLGTVVG